MIRFKKYFIAALLICISTVLFISCKEDLYDPYEDMPAPEGNIAASTSSTVYGLRNNIVTFSYDIMNQSNMEALIKSCGTDNIFYTIQKKGGNNWQLYNQMECVGAYSFSLNPNSTLTGILQINETGTYRIKFEFQWSKLPEAYDSVFTNTFAVINP